MFRLCCSLTTLLLQWGWETFEQRFNKEHRLDRLETLQQNLIANGFRHLKCVRKRASALPEAACVVQVPTSCVPARRKINCFTPGLTYRSDYYLFNDHPDFTGVDRCCVSQ